MKFLEQKHKTGHMMRIDVNVISSKMTYSRETVNRVSKETP